ncbi:DUF2971 domain-containing protein [Halanaerobium hydrogeniformans]|uniref:DUF2971 domain-containing protein n=1 Tax=Halanaerobium hydrogeniformans TaxID=656519 RepID=E4RNP1_HALHG|nr:DUF2971 domain-containing protein [Halanaerobium hydrogeniformans]ADQ13719.1 hypothetical protein Halsa_0237 [Halanaerobium hydrogeniformans]
MQNKTIWRYMSLAKYIDLLRTDSLYFPKASCFNDETEGKWALHSFLIANKIRLTKMKENKKVIERILDKTNNNVQLYNQVIKALNEGEINDRLKETLERFKFYHNNNPEHKGRKHLENLVSGWSKQINNYSETKEEHISQAATHRESTYISCWYSADEMSLAMWKLFGGGKESVAIRTKINKLKDIIEKNDDCLNNKGYEGDVSEVEYISDLKEPDEKTREKIISILTKGKTANVGQFCIKPKEYEYESEVRTIIYPKKDIYDKVVDPDPDKDSFSIPIVTGMEQFIDEVYIHPLEDKDSMIFKVIKEINKSFDVEIPIISNSIEAFGDEIDL